MEVRDPENEKQPLRAAVTRDVWNISEAFTRDSLGKEVLVASKRFIKAVPWALAQMLTLGRGSAAQSAWAARSPWDHGAAPHPCLTLGSSVVYSSVLIKARAWGECVCSHFYNKKLF